MNLGNFAKYRHFCVILPIALGWGLLHFFGLLVSLENLAMDWRFRVRGPIDSKAKIAYVNRDTLTSGYFGEGAFPRTHYATVGKAMLELGNAQVVFFDFVMSGDYYSEMINPKLIYAGNNAMRTLSLFNPNKVVLAASFSNKKYGFDQYSSSLPYKAEGAFQVINSSPLGYDAALNPVPELPEFPLWTPRVEDPLYPVGQAGRVGLIDMSKRLNRGAIDRYVPAFVEVHNEKPALYLANSAARWEAFLASGGDIFADRKGLGFNVYEENGYNWVKNKADEVKAVFPQQIPLTFYTAAVEILRAIHPQTTIQFDQQELRFIREDGSILYHIPLIQEQHIGINWYSSWLTGFPELEAARAQLLAEEEVLKVEGRLDELSWSFRKLAQETDKWILAVEAGDLKATRGIRLWGVPNDPYNPQVSFFEVIILFQAYQLATEQKAERTLHFIEDLFKQFEDHIILVGPTDALLQDLAPTPFDSNPSPKVATHGNLLKTIIDGNFIVKSPAWVTPFAILLLTLLVELLAVGGGLQSRINKLGAIFILIVYVCFTFLLFNQFNYVIPLIAPMGAAITSGAIGLMIQLLIEENQKARIRSMFGTYVSPELVNRMIDSEEAPKLGGHHAQITAFFSDIQSFSSFSEELEPDKLVELMNEYLNAMTEILEAEEGTLDKYIGDAIVGIFGAPVTVESHAYRACRAAQHIQRRQVELCAKWVSEGDKWTQRVHHMRTRIGLNSGEAIVGNMGSEKRFNYTMMGDTVNLAARNESGAKSYGVYTMVAGETKVEAEKYGDDIVFRYLDKIVVKGRSRPVDIYEIVGLTGDVSEPTRECLRIYDEAMQAYLARDWSTAMDRFEASAKLEPYQPNASTFIATNPSLVLLERTRIYAVNPPGDDWDGRYIMTSK